MNRRHGGRPPEVPAAQLPRRVRLSPADITAVTFTRVRRRGLDPTEVYTLLSRVAFDLAVRDRDVAALADENYRLKTALTDWQTGHAQVPTGDGYHHRPSQAESPQPEQPEPGLPSVDPGAGLPRRQPGSAYGWNIPTAVHPTRADPPGPAPKFGSGIGDPWQPVAGHRSERSWA